MLAKYKKLKNDHGLSLIEIIVSMLVIMLLGLGVYSLIIFSLSVTADNKMYVEAVRVANQKMEQIFNLPYDQVGIIEGEPSGVLAATETKGLADIFTVETHVSYYDDPYDGFFGAEDSNGEDYKVVTVRVSFQGKSGNKEVSLFSKIVPNSL